MRLASFALAVLLAGCVPRSEAIAPSGLPSPAVPTPSATATEPAATIPPRATPSPTAEPAPRTTRTIADIAFSLDRGPADLRVETALSRRDEADIAAAVASDVAFVEKEFARTFSGPPIIYVFATSESYAVGLERIFGYSAAAAAFVADNSVSYFEPSLLTIAVNWQAVGDRRPLSAIRHELTHRITLDACRPRCDLVPAWFNEGEARLAEALVPGGDWRMLRVRYEAASMASTNTLIPLNTLVSQRAWNALTDWAGYYKYQEAARATELFRDDVGGSEPMARVYERFRRGENIAQAYASLTGRSFDDFVLGLRERMTEGTPAGPGLVTVPTPPQGTGVSFLLYGFAPSSTVSLTISGPRLSETSAVQISPFGAVFDGLPATRAQGGYTLSVQHPGGVITAQAFKQGAGQPGDTR